MKEVFYINMKLINLIQIKNVFKPDMKFKNIQIGYKVMKFLKSIESDTTFYDTKLAEIAQECAEKDGDKIKTTENGNLVLAKDKIFDWKWEKNNEEVDGHYFHLCNTVHLFSRLHTGEGAGEMLL